MKVALKTCEGELDGMKSFICKPHLKTSCVNVCLKNLQKQLSFKEIFLIFFSKNSHSYSYITNLS